MAPEVFYSVCYGDKDVHPSIAQLHSFHPAVLHGYCRRRVRWADYPGVIEDANHQVFGTYATGLTDANMQKLDTFEGSEYVRRKVKVRLLAKVGNAQGEGNVEGEEREAEVYVFIRENELVDREWDFEEFRRERLGLWTRGVRD